MHEPELLNELLVRVQKGDRQAFSSLYDVTAAQVLGLAVHVLHDRAQAEEIAQEVFLELWRQAQSFDPAKGTARAWIFRLTRQRAIDRLRSHRAAVTRDDRDAFLEAAKYVESVEQETITILDRQSVRAALEKVGEPHRTAILLAYFQGLTNRELAEATGVALGTAKTRLRDGLRKLHRELVRQEQGNNAQLSAEPKAKAEVRKL
ncbi:MAG: sigma-70 family RNA polymerase sigma factor [Corynebacterium sp.]|uniref:sigma-70 family RNA polymerase sigma factor n=1 Tax=Corynebacterium sp. TaxID=1720 RepID=UPI0026DD1872|nr:sigma-70 family RNA polymerase sigma factor [Corynebacterium sp.]MDO5030602.1 sigma-70 family RNA polymerase sigma factor [Corynebacterium sp.]